MHITIEEDGSKRILRLEGRIDATSSPVLENKIAQLLEKKHKQILIDFAKVDYLSSAGMRLLLSATKKCKASGGHLVFCSINDEVMEIIKMAGFERILSIYPNEQQAIEALDKG